MTYIRGNSIAPGVSSYFSLYNPTYYTSGSLFWNDRLNNGNYFDVSSSFHNKQMDISGSKNCVLNSDAEIFTPNSVEDGYTLSVFFKTDRNEQYIFGKGDSFSLFLTPSNQIISRLKHNVYCIFYNLALVGGKLIGHNAYNIDIFDSNSLEMIDERWAFNSSKSPAGTNNYAIAAGRGTKWTGSWFSDQYFRVTRYDLTNYKYALGTNVVIRTQGIGVPQTYAQAIYGVAADDNYYYYCDGANNRICAASGSGSSGVNYYTHSTCRTPIAIDVDDSFAYVLSDVSHSIYKFNLPDLSLAQWTGSASAAEVTAEAKYAFEPLPTISGSSVFMDIKVDGDYLYITDNAKKIKVFNKADLTWVTSCSIKNTYGMNIYGLTMDDNYIYFSGEDCIGKMVKSDFTTGSADWIKKTPKYTHPLTTSILRGDLRYVGAGTEKGIEADGKISGSSDNFIHCTDRSRFYYRYRKNDLYGNITYVTMSLLGTGGAQWDYHDCYSFYRDDANFYMAMYEGHHVLKCRVVDFVYVTHSGVMSTTGTDSWSFNGSLAISIDGDFVYATDTSNHRVKKLNKEDLNVVAISPSGALFTPSYLTVSGSYIYVGSGANTQPFKILNTSDLSYYSESRLTTGTNINYNIKYDPYTNRFYTRQGGVSQIYSIWIPDPNNTAGLTQFYTKTIPQDEFGEWGYYNPAYGQSINANFHYNANESHIMVLNKDNGTVINDVNLFSRNLTSSPISNLTSSVWHNVVITLQSGSMAMYIDGIKNVSESMYNNHLFRCQKLTYLGRWEQNGVTTTGIVPVYGSASIGSIITWRRALSDEEVYNTYLALSGSFV